MKGRRQQEVLLGLGSRRISPKIPLSDKLLWPGLWGLACAEKLRFPSPQLIRCGLSIPGQGPSVMV